MNRRRIVTLAMLAGALGACSGKDIVGPSTSTPPPPPPAAGTTISAAVSGESFWQIGYSWSLQAESPEDTVALGSGQSGLISFALVADRAENGSASGATGEVCVNNSGGQATQGLAVVVRIQRQVGESWQNVAGATQTLSVSQQVAAGQQGCLPFEIAFEREDGVSYRAQADVSISNMGAENPQAGSVGSLAALSFPAEPAAADAAASLAASVDCPAGFDCTPVQSSWALNGPASIIFNVEVVNAAAACGENAQLSSSLSLVQATSETVHSASGSAMLFAAPCSCTQKAGWWRDNSGANGSPDHVSDKLPIWLGTAGGAMSVEVTSASQARDILSNTGGSNGIPKLSRQLLAARLNVAEGVSDAAVADVMAAADAFLANHDASSWNSLSEAQKDEVNSLGAALDDWNSGITGPGACS